MNAQLKDFVSTYRRPPHQPPFAGYFKDAKYTPKRKFKKVDPDPLYIKVCKLQEHGYTRQQIAAKLDRSMVSINSAIKYLKDKIKNI